MQAVISAMRHQIVGWHWTHLKRHLDDGREDDFPMFLSLVEFGPRRFAVRGYHLLPWWSGSRIQTAERAKFGGECTFLF
jgi:hypothetical protein